MMNFTGPEPDALREVLRSMGGWIKARMPKNWGFTLLMFEYGNGGSCMYISTAQREDMKRTMRELLTKWDREDQTSTNTNKGDN